ncbi:MAG: phage holin family protein [Myxococcales bacterium]|nr:phage holin family protein [Myxococcales bacterium]
MAPRETQDRSTTLARRDAPAAPRAAGAVARAEPQAVARSQAVAGEASLATLVKDAVGETAGVLQAQVELAVLEVREDAKVAAQIGVVFGIGGALGFLALAMLLAAAAFGLAQVMPAWAACLVVGGAVGTVAAIVLVRGRDRLRAHRFAEQSTLALEEGKQWIREKLS